ncbi:hypothetical protein BGZ83_011359 [Gryganskiella cystojenkinii]|nr:hypothetical protein BGZ83_011359 [Gryganskiella cystojenkinii]
MTVTSHAWLDIIIGVVVSVVSSIMNAAGLNLLKLDHVRNRALVMERQRQDCSRPMWLLGLTLYVGSQIAGSTIALNFLKTQWVAPLGSIALIFNFIFAKILVGTRITQRDVLGTVIVMVSVVWIVCFGNMNSAGADIEDSLTIIDLKNLFSRIVFIIYFSILNLAIIGLLALGTYAYWAITLDESNLDPTTERQIRKRMKMKLTALLGKNRFTRATGLACEEDEDESDIEGGNGVEERIGAARDLLMKKVVAMIMATCGGLLAGETLLLAKSGIKLITSSIPGAAAGHGIGEGAGGGTIPAPGGQGQNQFQDSLSFFILFLLVLTAIMQVVCLNMALKLYDSVLVVPIFYGFYATFGLFNSMIYLNQVSDYQVWVLILILVGIVALIFGVRLLSAPKPEIGAGASAVMVAGTAPTGGDDGHGGLLVGEEHEGKILGDAKLGRTDHPSGQEHYQQQPGFGKEIVEAHDADGILDLATLTPTEPDSITLSSTAATPRRFSFLNKWGDPFSRKRDSSSTMTTTVASGTGAEIVIVNSIHGITADNEDLERSAYGQQRTKHSRQGSIQAPHQIIAALKGNSISGDKYRDEADEGRGRNAIDGRKRIPPPRIDTLSGSGGGVPTSPTAAAYVRGRSETRRRQSSPGGPRPMSPSEFRAQYTNSPFPIKPKHLKEGAPGLGSRSSSPGAWGDGKDGQRSRSTQRGHSPRWSTVSAKMDQVFEDLNPFKNFRRSSVDLGVGHGRQPRSRQTSLSGLPSEWDEAALNRKLNHSTLFGENGSRHSSRASSPSGSQYSTPSHSRRQSTTTEMVGGGSGMMLDEEISGIGPLDPAPRYSDRDYYGAGNSSSSSQPGQEPQRYQNHYFTGTPPPLSATLQHQSSFGTLPEAVHHSHHHHHHSGSHPYPTKAHGRQLSFTTKNDGRGSSSSSTGGMAAALASVGLSKGSGSSPFGNTSGTFGPPSGNRSFSAVGSSASPTTDSPGSSSGQNFLPLSVQLQLQQLSQLQHYPTSQLQHSMTTSSISTIGSVMPQKTRPSDGISVSSAFSTETSLAQFVTQGMTPSQSLQAMELDMDQVEREMEYEYGGGGQGEEHDDDLD